MEKSATLNLRVNPKVKKQAEEVLDRLGIPMSVAIDMYLNQINLTGGIPFMVTLPGGPDILNVDRMSAAELREALDQGYEEGKSGRSHEAVSALKDLREKLSV